MNPNDRQRPLLEHRQDPIPDSVEVLHQVPLRRAGSVEEGLVQVRQPDAIAFFGFTRGAHRIADAITRRCTSPEDQAMGLRPRSRRETARVV